MAGRIERIGEALEPAAGGEVLDAAGRLVCPGLVDLHLHCFFRGHVLGVDADALAPASGTTTFVDAGSCGALGFLGFREYVIRPAAARILAFLNISAIGLQSVGIDRNEVGENDDERFLHGAAAIEMIEKNRDLIAGVKVRMYTGLRSLAPLARARDVADRVRLPLMVHIASGMPPFREMLPLLRPGDIITHIYHGGSDTLLDEGGRVRDEFTEARARGILFDVGLDRVHTDFEIAAGQSPEGFDPHSLSTDLTTSNRHITEDMPTTISKFVGLGLGLEDGSGEIHSGSCGDARASRRIRRPPRGAGGRRWDLRASRGNTHLQRHLRPHTFGRLAARALAHDSKRGPALARPSERSNGTSLC